MNATAVKVLLAFLASAAMANPIDDYCGFYEEDACTRQVGSDTYSVYNDGVFQNSGPYFGCGTDQEFSLISYGPDGSDGTNPQVCHVFTSTEASEGCTHLDDLGFNTGAGNYYKITLDKVCPSTSKRSTIANSTINSSKRDANYLTFYNDPACTEQSGSVSYSLDNDGCFENGGAYASMPGDNFNWSLNQYAGESCADSIEHCTHNDPFVPTPEGGNVIPCVHIDDTGLQSGTGSYKILSGGCP